MGAFTFVRLNGTGTAKGRPARAVDTFTGKVFAIALPLELLLLLLLLLLLPLLLLEVLLSESLSESLPCIPCCCAKADITLNPLNSLHSHSHTHSLTAHCSSQITPNNENYRSYLLQEMLY
jgi:hypothetical protein